MFIEFIRAKLSNLSARVSGVEVRRSQGDGVVLSEPDDGEERHAALGGRPGDYLRSDAAGAASE